MRVALVGPSPPDRGGIAQQTRLLATALGPALAGYFSFARPYPRWLDPRRFDALRSSPTDSEVPAAPLLDYARPASWRKTADAVLDSGADAVLVPWWTSFWAIPMRSLLGQLRKRRPEIVRILLCHNVIEHETSLWKRALSRRIFQAADGLIVHSPEDRAALTAMARNRPALLLAHPVEARPRPDRAASRRALGIERPLVLFLGLVRRYKGLETLIEAAPQIVSETGAEIAIVGEVFGDARPLLGRIARSSAASSFRVVDRYVTEAEMDSWLAACDLVICPYWRISGSGIAARAVAARRPILASDLAGFHPFVSDATGELVPPGDARELSRAAVRLLQSGLERFERGLAEVESRCSWERYAAAILKFCRSLRIESATIRP